MPPPSSLRGSIAVRGAARQRRDLVRRPDGARGDQRRQLRHVSSGAGRGPLYNARRSVRDCVTTLRDGMTQSWLEPVQADIEQLRQCGGRTRGRHGRGAAAGLRSQGIRNPRPGAQYRRAQSNELGKSTAAEMRALAAGVSVAARCGRLLLLRSDARPAPDARRPSRPSSRRIVQAARGRPSTKARPASPTRSRTCGRTSAPTDRRWCGTVLRRRR